MGLGHLILRGGRASHVRYAQAWHADLTWRRELLNRGLQEQPVDGEVAIRAVELRDFHKDPGDRLIVATALVLGGTLLTSDEKILGWLGPLDRIDARR